MVSLRASEPKRCPWSSEVDTRLGLEPRVAADTGSKKGPAGGLLASTICWTKLPKGPERRGFLPSVSHTAHVWQSEQDQVPPDLLLTPAAHTPWSQQPGFPRRGRWTRNRLTLAPWLRLFWTCSPLPLHLPPHTSVSAAGNTHLHTCHTSFPQFLSPHDTSIVIHSHPDSKLECPPEPPGSPLSTQNCSLDVFHKSPAKTSPSS